jgi:hypothetical protein
MADGMVAVVFFDGEGSEMIDDKIESGRRYVA